jgi:hypothetical protein
MIDKHDRLGQMPFSRESRDGQAWRDRLVYPPERLVEPNQEFPAEASRQRRAGRRHDDACRPEADAFETATGFDGKPQCGERQRRQPVRFVSRRNRRERKTRCCPRRARCRGKSRPHAEALVEQARQEIVEHRLFAAEEVGATGDVEEQPIRAIQRHQRRIAVAPVGQAFEQPPVGFRIGFLHFERGVHGASIG